MTTDLTKLDAANKALQADTKAAKSTKAFAQAATDVLHAMNPAPPPSGGVGLYQLGGSLAACSHLTDDTYSVVIGDWDDAPLLATVRGESYAYTVTTSGVQSGAGFVILDANPNGGTLPDSLPPWEYASKCISYVQAHPGLDGIFLDNCLSTIPGLLAAMKTVSDAFRQVNVKWAANVGSYVSGQAGSDDGSLWRAFVPQVDPFLDRIMLENWQTPSNTTPPTTVRLRGQAWNQHWDDWQLCPPVAGGKFVAVTYGPASFGIYGRASQLIAGGGGVHVYSRGGPDPYSSAWATKTPNPVVDPVAGTASL